MYIVTFFQNNLLNRNSRPNRFSIRFRSNIRFYMFIIQAVVLFIFMYTAPFKIGGLITVFFIGLLAFMNVPGLQVYVVMLAERFVPTAVDVASAMNIAAFNIGIAFGSYLGGVITDSAGLIHTTWIGSLMVLSAVVLTGLSQILEERDQKPDGLLCQRCS